MRISSFARISARFCVKLQAPRLISAFFVLAICLSAVSCGSGGDPKAGAKSDTKSGAKSGPAGERDPKAAIIVPYADIKSKIGVDDIVTRAKRISPDVDLSATPNIKDTGSGVSLVFPGKMFEGVELNDEFIEVNRYIKASKAFDGKVVIEMSGERQREFLDAFSADVEYNARYFLSEVEYVSDILCAEDMRSMCFFMDADMDKHILYELPFVFSYFLENYQMMLGQEVWALMTIVDNKTNKPVFSLLFPDSVEIAETF